MWYNWRSCNPKTLLTGLQYWCRPSSSSSCREKTQKEEQRSCGTRFEEEVALLPHDSRLMALQLYGNKQLLLLEVVFDLRLSVVAAVCQY